MNQLREQPMGMREHILVLMDRAKGLVDRAIADVPADKLTTQVAGVPNHFLWTVGHLAESYQFFGAAGGAKMTGVPEAWHKMFGMGSEAVGDARKYPPMAEVKAAWDRAYGEIRSHLLTLTDAELDGPVVGSDGGGFLKSRADAFLTLAWHDGWHVGQLAALRKAIGLGPMLS
jgi:hypothetical protein